MCVMIAGMPSPRKNNPPRIYGAGLQPAQIVVDPAVWAEFKKLYPGMASGRLRAFMAHEVSRARARKTMVTR